jgi:eukaryotic-like serine/threonine-protein kinase
VRYPADVTGRNQVALCSSKLRDLRRAVDEMQRIVQLLPKRALFRDNLALYANYAGDFQTGEREARAVQGPDTYGSLALAFAQVGQGQFAEARQTYEKLRTIDALGASFATSGLADLAMVEGRYSEAASELEAAVAVELASKNTDRAASKLVTLAHVRLLQNQKAMAVAAAERALMNGSDVKIRLMAGRAFIEAGQAAKARTLLAGLDAELQAEPRAYAKILEGEIALKEGRARDAIKSFSDASTLFDTWLGNFDLGRAYFDAGAMPQADSQFERCLKRRGEALSLFLDEEATYGFFPPVYYYQGRVREAMKSARFAEPYRRYIDLRGAANEDRLLPEVRGRAGTR